MCRSAEIEDEDENKGQRGVGLAVKQIALQTAVHLTELISNRLLKVAQDLRGRAKVVSFALAYVFNE